mmetsp:Transcript_4494/g.13609  ORF Transcript_4494/g.13609 Transcript_4494/m.13609 type:complete len:239 (-) Transcript_4494:161-877(-)
MEVVLDLRSSLLQVGLQLLQSFLLIISMLATLQQPVDLLLPLRAGLELLHPLALQQQELLLVLLQPPRSLIHHFPHLLLLLDELLSLVCRQARVGQELIQALAEELIAPHLRHDLVQGYLLLQVCHGVDLLGLELLPAPLRAVLLPRGLLGAGPRPRLGGQIVDNGAGIEVIRSPRGPFGLRSLLLEKVSLVIKLLPGLLRRQELVDGLRAEIVQRGIPRLLRDELPQDPVVLRQELA